ncbi:MAG: integration host factor subunit beta [Candidatus Marinimicrobia bacterium]|nr:integration host factor subunit beta [Candidatus Neomarinimicrobiota bacterium]MBL7047025.1 integration host factor subunit beta [Candidatus Neomarinimicrobiota bacterium]
MDVKTYTKKDISKRVAKNLNKGVSPIHDVVSETFGVMLEMLSEDRNNVRIEVRNFGVLTVKPTKAKPKARNPRTNEEIYVPPHRKTHFKPGKVLKDVLKKPL